MRKRILHFSVGEFIRIRGVYCSIESKPAYLHEEGNVYVLIGIPGLLYAQLFRFHSGEEFEWSLKEQNANSGRDLPQKED